MDNLTVLLGTQRTVGLAFNANPDMSDMSVVVAGTPGLAHAPSEAAGGSLNDSTSIS